MTRSASVFQTWIVVVQGKAFVHKSRIVIFYNFEFGQWLWEVASDTRGPQFEFIHRQNLYLTLLTVNCIEKTKIKKKGRDGRFLKQFRVAANTELGPDKLWSQTSMMLQKSTVIWETGAGY